MHQITITLLEANVLWNDIKFKATPGLLSNADWTKAGIMEVHVLLESGYMYLVGIEQKSCKVSTKFKSIVKTKSL